MHARRGVQSIEDIRNDSYNAVVKRLTAGWVETPTGWRKIEGGVETPEASK